MSINELEYRKSSLTPEQIRQAETSIYGLPQPQPGAADPQNLTAEQAELLRTLLLQYDANHGQVNEFDLNKPPQKPYKYQEYPRMIYHHEKREYAIVQNKDQLDLMLARGYRLEPCSVEVDTAPALDMATVAEARAIDAQLKAPRQSEAFEAARAVLEGK